MDNGVVPIKMTVIFSKVQLGPGITIRSITIHST